MNNDDALGASYLAAANARAAKAAKIAQQIRLAQPMDEANFLSLSQALLGASDTALDAAAAADSYKAAMAAVRSEAKSLGDVDHDFVFFPIAPCRLLDTRVGTPTPLVAGVPYGVDFDGGNQGNAAGCTFIGVVAQLGGTTSGLSRPALALNVTVTQPAGPGHIRVRPVGSTLTASTQNFTTGQTVANMAIVQDAGTVDEFELWASIQTHAIVDVLGVFAPPVATALQCQNAESASTPIANGSTFTVAAPACPAGYSPTGPTFRNTSTFSVNFVINNMFPNGTSYTCQGQNVSGATVNFQCGVRCCRVPGR